MSRTFDPKEIKAIAIDLDGTTLLPDTKLGSYTTEIFKKLLSRGMQIIICTGRAVESTEMYREAIGTEGPMVFFNGAVVVDTPSNKLLYANLVDMDIADYGVDIAHKMGIHYQIYLAAGLSPDTGEPDSAIRWEPLVIDKECPESDMYRKHTGITPLVTNLKHVTGLQGVQGCIKSMFIADSSLHDEIRREMNARFGSRINIIRSFPTFLEILSAGVSKGGGLKTAMEHRGLQPHEVIAFGDEENDLSMFTVTGYAVTLANARENIRNAADLVIGSNADESLAAYLENIFLNK
jgi:Cof subfamily protein (haloacid dehalogenase superfamily)